MARILLVEKAPLRSDLMQQRERLPQAERLVAEKKIADALSARAVMERWLQVAVFLPWRGEPDLMSTWRAWHARGLRLALPVVVAQDAPLVMQEWQPGGALIRDAMGLQVPDQTQTLACDTWVIPCVGVDVNGGRLGAGKGFYDRTAAALRMTHTDLPRLIGVCFDYALSSHSFAEPHDLRLDACVTELGWHDFRAG